MIAELNARIACIEHQRNKALADAAFKYGKIVVLQEQLEQANAKIQELEARLNESDDGLSAE